MRRLVTFVAMWPGLVLANAAGITGYSGIGSQGTCGTCHQGATGAMAMLSGPTTLAAGATGTYTFTLSGGPAMVGGLDVAADNAGATLSVSGTGVQVRSNEVIQTGATQFGTSGSLVFTFSMKAPSSAGTVKLYASGVSANGDQNITGDSAASTTLSVTVGGGSGGGGGGCSASGSAGGAVGLAVAGLALALGLRRRHA